MENQNETQSAEQHAVVDLIELYHNTIKHFQKRLASSKKQITHQELDQLRRFFVDLGVTEDMSKVLKEHVNYSQRSHEIKYGENYKPSFGQFVDETPDDLPFPTKERSIDGVECNE